MINLAKLKILVLVFLFLSLLGCPSSDDCPSFAVTYVGNVRDQSNNPIQGVSASLSVRGLNPEEVAWTDANGDFSFTQYLQAPVGSVYFVFSKSGYSNLTTETKEVAPSCVDTTARFDGELSP
ncbi:MAG: carboxypeptidase-like regulatory domain-containing protein [Bdellovibrionales bacterium]|nr:carboxypeptidase-like regulatory domain-containing protein [Bdellovibrionales bacterium]